LRGTLTAFPAVHADNESARQNLRMPAKIRIDFKRSFSITVLRKKAPNIERGIQLSHFHLLFSAFRAARLLRAVSRAATLA